MLPSQSTGGKRGKLFWLLVGLAFFGGGGAIFAYLTYFKSPAERPDVVLHKVKMEDLAITVTEKGTLESADNRDVVCRVRAGNKGYATSINWVIDDGTLVKKGQLLMILDDSDFQDKFRAEKILVDQALAGKLSAEEQYHITLKQNEIDIALAQTNVSIAEINLEQYTGIKAEAGRTALAAVIGGAGTLVETGLYRQQYDDLTGQLRMAESDAEQNRERAAWAERMVKMRYMSPAQSQAERSRLESSVEKLRSVQAQRQILEVFTRKVELTDRVSKLDNARKLLDQAHKKAQATEIQADVDRRTKNSIYLQEVEKLKDIEEQIHECRIHAPQDGMVVYYKSESSSRFSSSTGNVVEQGAQVKEGQKMLRIPDLRRMQVNTKVHEAMVSRIRGDVRKSTGFSDAVRAALLVNPDAITRLTSVHDDYQEVLRTQHRDRESYIASPGQRATIRVDALPDRVLPGHVRSVAAVANQQDFMSSDVKLYSTLVLIEEAVNGLKPDMSAEVTIHVDKVKEKVLAIPLQAVVGGAEMGQARKVHVRTPAGYQEREVKLGLSNEKMVEVREGLNEGDDVVLNPKVLIGEKAKTRELDDSKPQRGTDKADVKGGDGKGKKKKAAPAGGAPMQ